MIPITAYYIALIVLLAIPSDAYHRVCLGVVGAALIVLYGAAAVMSEKTFYLLQAVTWVLIAFSLLSFNNGWRSVRVGSILLVVAGVCVFPAWLEGAELVPFTSVSLVFSGFLGVGAIIAFGFPGLRRACAWLGGLGRTARSRRMGDSLRDL